jgi:hypothetical protein
MGEDDLYRRVRVLEELVHLLIEAMPPGARDEIRAKAEALQMTTGMLDYLAREGTAKDAR